MNVKVDESRGNNFPGGVDHLVDGLRFVRPHGANRIVLYQDGAVRDDFMALAGPTHDYAAIDAYLHYSILNLQFLPGYFKISDSGDLGARLRERRHRSEECNAVSNHTKQP